MSGILQPLRLKAAGLWPANVYNIIELTRQHRDGIVGDSKEVVSMPLEPTEALLLWHLFGLEWHQGSVEGHPRYLGPAKSNRELRKLGVHFARNMGSTYKAEKPKIDLKPGETAYHVALKREVALELLKSFHACLRQHQGHAEGVAAELNEFRFITRLEEPLPDRTARPDIQIGLDTQDLGRIIVEIDFSSKTSVKHAQAYILDPRGAVNVVVIFNTSYRRLRRRLAKPDASFTTTVTVVRAVTVDGNVAYQFEGRDIPVTAASIDSIQFSLFDLNERLSKSAVFSVPLARIHLLAQNAADSQAIWDAASIGGDSSGVVARRSARMSEIAKYWQESRQAEQAEDRVRYSSQWSSHGQPPGGS